MRYISALTQKNAASVKAMFKSFEEGLSLRAELALFSFKLEEAVAAFTAVREAIWDCPIKKQSAEYNAWEIVRQCAKDVSDFALRAHALEKDSEANFTQQTVVLCLQRVQQAVINEIETSHNMGMFADVNRVQQRIQEQYNMTVDELKQEVAKGTRLTQEQVDEEYKMMMRSVPDPNLVNNNGHTNDVSFFKFSQAS